MAICDIQIGRGSKILIARLGGTCVEPAQFSVTTAVATARNTAATTVTVPALPTGAFVPAGTWLKAVNPNGTESLLKLTANAVATDTTLAVTNVPVAIAIGAIISYPSVIGSRSGANFQDSGNSVETFTLESGGYSENRVSTRSATVEMPGRFDALNPGFLNARDSALGQEFVYLWMEDLAPSSNYSKGQVIKGIGSVINYGKNIDAQQITMSDLSFKFNGSPIIVEPVLI